MSEKYESPVQESGKRIPKEKDPLNKFSWDSAPKFLTEMLRKNAEKLGANPEMQVFMEQIIRELLMTKSEQKKYLRPNTVSYAYRQNYEELKKNVPRLNIAAGLTIEQILALDRHFHRTYVNNNIVAGVLQRYGCTGYMSGKKWEMKHHKLTDLGTPYFSQSFRNLGEITVGPEGIKTTGYGWGAKYEIPFTTLDMAAGGIYDPEYWLIFFLAQKMGIFGDERLLLGGAGRTTTGRGAPALQGLYNSASPNPMTDLIITPSTDMNFDAGKGDFDEAFEDSMTEFMSNSVFGAGGTIGSNNVFITTSGIATETYMHDATTLDFKTLYQVLQDKWFVSNNIGAWYVSDNLVSTALASMTSATQAALMIKASPNYIRRTVVYPLQRKILSEKFKTYPDDVAFAYITGDILQMYDGNACQAFHGSTSNAVCTLRGFVMNGLFMDGQTTGIKARQPPPGVY